MKRRIVFGFLALIILLLCSTVAVAEQKTNPARKEAERRMIWAKQLRSASQTLISNDISCTVNKNLATPKPGDTITFTFTVSGSSGNNLSYYIQIGEEQYGLMYSNDCYKETSLAYKFFSAGDYSCNVWFYENGEYIGFNYVDFSIADDDEHLTFEEKAQQIVSSCRGSTDWSTALNLYNWLMDHVYYMEEPLTHYGIDVLFLGYGVCDSYSKAYMLLCNTAGITAERITSPSHAWNTIKLGGKWYQVDCTWDDPEEGTSSYSYFCLNSAIMQQIDAHELEDAGHALSCTSLDMNYYIKTKKWQKWGDWDWDYDEWHSTVKRYTDNAIQTFDSGYAVHEFVIDDIYYLADSGEAEWVCIDTIIANGILEYALPGYSWKMADGDEIKVESALKNNTFQLVLKGWKLNETGTLKLPQKLKAIQDQGFAGIKANTVVLPKTCTSIGAKAFLNSSVRTIHIPASTVEIDDTAFSGCGRIIIVTLDNSSAAEYAREHGMMVAQP